MADLPRRIQDEIERRKLFSPAQGILVAVSGGVDSMVLLHVLHQLAPANRWRLVVAHLNHQLRGRSSKADERLVRSTARSLKLNAVIQSADVKALAKSEKLSLEMAARKARHDFLARTAARLRIGTVALAHHADDRVELFFLRLLRGGGTEGLSGMKWKNPSPVSSKVELVRPLLGCAKRELRQYARAVRLKSREDASNASLDFQRNRIRHELLPLLKEKFQPRVESVLLRVADIVGTEADFVGRAAAEWLQRAEAAADEVRPSKLKGIPHSDFDHLHVAVQRRVIILQLRTMRVAPDFELVEELREHPNCPIMVSFGTGAGHKEFPHPLDLRVNASGGLLLERSGNGLLKRSFAGRSLFMKSSRRLALDRKGQVAFSGLQVCWQLVKPPGGSRPKACNHKELFDAAKLGEAGILRHWAPGDRFRPIGMVSEVKLQDLFTNLKVPREERHRRLLGVSAGGEIFWVEGLRIAERFKLTTSTTRALLWAWERL